MSSNHTQDKIYLSVIIAAYNEEAVISNNLRRLVDTLMERPDVKWEIICVNDGSKDKTADLIDQAAAADSRIHVLHHRRNFGQGRALRTAFDAARGEFFVTMDADLSYSPEYAYRMADALEESKADIALASPYMKGGSVQNVPFYRFFLSRAGNFYLGRMTGFRTSTSTCVVRAYRREVLDTLVLTSDGMELQIETLNKAFIMGYRVVEIPARLEWEKEKAEQAGFRRVSKMRIGRTIRLYLLMGWLARPAVLFIPFSLGLILPGAYMAMFLTYRVLAAIYKHLNEGLAWAVTRALSEVFSTYTYSVVISAILLLIGLQMLAFSFLLLQNQLNFEELYRLGLTRNKKP